MTNWLTAIVSLAGLLVGAGLAVVGAHWKEPSLINLASMVIGGALGAFVPQGRPPHNGIVPPPRRKPDPPGQ